MDDLRNPDRRTAICAGAIGLASIATLTACGNTASPDTAGTSGQDGGAVPQDQASQDQAGQSQGGQSQGGQDQGGQPPLLMSAIPVGGVTPATGADGKPVIVARPQDDQVVAFSAVCTHQGCQVVPNKERLDCPCHGSQFDAMTGKVLQGPATKALPPVNIQVQGQQILLG